MASGEGKSDWFAIRVSQPPCVAARIDVFGEHVHSVSQSAVGSAEGCGVVSRQDAEDRLGIVDRWAAKGVSWRKPAEVVHGGYLRGIGLQLPSR